MNDKRLVMYGRSYGCPYITIAKRVLNDHALQWHEIQIDKDPEAKERVLDWTGFLSVPTIIVAEAESIMPITPPEPLLKGVSPRGIDRGSMITEPSLDEFERWLTRHGFIDEGGNGLADPGAG